MVFIISTSVSKKMIAVVKLKFEIFKSISKLFYRLMLIYEEKKEKIRSCYCGYKPYFQRTNK